MWIQGEHQIQLNKYLSVFFLECLQRWVGWFLHISVKAKRRKT